MRRRVVYLDIEPPVKVSPGLRAADVPGMEGRIPAMETGIPLAISGVVPDSVTGVGRKAR
jgi:hypothetical protein